MNNREQLEQKFKKILSEELNTRGFYDLLFQNSISKKSESFILAAKLSFSSSTFHFCLNNRAKSRQKIEILKIWIIETTCIEVFPTPVFTVFDLEPSFSLKLICKFLRWNEQEFLIWMKICIVCRTWLFNDSVNCNRYLVSTGLRGILLLPIWFNSGVFLLVTVDVWENLALVLDTLLLCYW